MLNRTTITDAQNGRTRDKRLRVHTRPRPGTFGALVRNHRCDLDLSQSALAARIGCDVSYVSRIESNSRTPERVTTILALAQALELGTAQLLGLIHAAAAAAVEEEHHVHLTD